MADAIVCPERASFKWDPTYQWNISESCVEVDADAVGIGVGGQLNNDAHLNCS